MAYWNFGFVMDGGGDSENVPTNTSAVRDASLSVNTLSKWKQQEQDYIQSANKQVSSLYNRASYQPLQGMRLVSVICPHHPSLLTDLGPGVTLSLCDITADHAPLPGCPKYVSLIQGEYIPGLYTHVEVPVGVDLRFHYCIRRDSDNEILAIDSFAATGRTHLVVPDRVVYYNRPHLELVQSQPTVAVDSHVLGTVNESYVSDDSQHPLTTLVTSPPPEPATRPSTSQDESVQDMQFRLSRQTSRSKLNRFASAVGRAFRCIPSE